MDKEVVGTIEYYSAIKKNVFESVLTRWMKLEPIIHSEVSQKEKDKHRLLTHLYENLERQYLMNLSEGQKWRCRQRTDL